MFLSRHDGSDAGEHYSWLYRILRTGGLLEDGEHIWPILGNSERSLGQETALKGKYLVGNIWRVHIPMECR